MYLSDILVLWPAWWIAIGAIGLNGFLLGGFLGLMLHEVRGEKIDPMAVGASALRTAAYFAGIAWFVGMVGRLVAVLWTG